MTWLKYVFGVTILLGMTAPVWAQNQEDKSQTPSVTSSGSGVLSPAQQRAEWFKAMAAIAEEQAKPQPDQQKIAALQQKLFQLRQQGFAPGWQPGIGFQAPPTMMRPCPWGGPGLGMGMGRGPGPGGPRGPGYGMGAPMGRGYRGGPRMW
ncbi:MAG TPA: hypothetical protein PL064_12680 [Thermogutta sp.]|nr:hypothetical protein [Thermogutta sp.]